MQKFALIFLVGAVAFIYAQDTRLGQEPPKAKQSVNYPIKVHVSGVHIRTHCTDVLSHAFCEDVIYADAVLNGQKIELMGDHFWFPGYPVPLVPGDYQVRLMKSDNGTPENPIGGKYELVFPDRFIWRCAVTGITE